MNSEENNIDLYKQALESFILFTLKRIKADGRLWHRDHWDNDFRQAIESCEKINIAGISEINDLEKQSDKLAQKTYCNQSHPNIFLEISFFLFGCNLCKDFSSAICIERQSGAFSPANEPKNRCSDKAKNQASSIKEQGKCHDKL